MAFEHYLIDLSLKVLKGTDWNWVQAEFNVVYRCLVSVRTWHHRRHHTPLTHNSPGEDTRPSVTWAVSLVTAEGAFNLPQGFMWVDMDRYAHFITPDCGTRFESHEVYFSRSDGRVPDLS